MTQAARLIVGGPDEHGIGHGIDRVEHGRLMVQVAAELLLHVFGHGFGGQLDNVAPGHSRPEERG